MSDSGRFWLKLTLTNTSGSISHTDQNGKAVSLLRVGHYTDLSIHIFGINSHTIQVWGTNESNPASAANAVQIGTDITGTALIALGTTAMSIFIETGTAGTGTPTCILTGRHAQ
jgi:hypothetical protein